MYFCLMVLEVLLHQKSEVFTSPCQEYFHLSQSMSHSRKERKQTNKQKNSHNAAAWMDAKSQPALLGCRRPSGRNELSVCLPNKIYKKIESCSSWRSSASSVFFTFISRIFKNKFLLSKGLQTIPFHCVTEFCPRWGSHLSIQSQLNRSKVW